MAANVASAVQPRKPAAPLADDGYWSSAKRPLTILLFLLPLIVAYEVSLALLLPDEAGVHVHTVDAHKSLLQFFAVFGIAPSGGLYLGGLVIVVVLFAWHLLARDAWRFQPATLAIMAAEAVFLTVPLLVLSHLVAADPSPAVAAAVAGAGAGAGPPAFADLDVGSQMAISVGAGLYEELLFRMILIALVHALLVDVGHAPDWAGAAAGVAVSAAAFTWYHDLAGPDGTISGRKALFYLLAGGYLGLVYTIRGFGLVVAVHALYDVVTVLLPEAPD